MKKLIVTLLIILISNWAKSQNVDYNSIKNTVVNLGDVHDANENFDGFSDLKPILKDVEIVMLGEQSHGEATTYDTKIKLIKYLHQELGFDLLVFESGIYDCNKAWQMITEENENVRDAMAKSIFGTWSTTNDFIPLVDYIEKTKDSSKPLELHGFDNQLTGNYSTDYFINDLSDYLKKMKPSILETSEWAHFSESINLVKTFRSKQFRKDKPEQDLAFILEVINEINKAESDSDSKFWTQVLKSAHIYLHDVSMKTEFRDKQMADNLMWIKEKYPDSKIICWGATSHFLYNSEEVRMKSFFVRILGGNFYKKQAMMGEYIKDKFQEKVYTIGFTAYQGEYGLVSNGEIKTPKEGSLEFLLGQSEYDNFLLPLNDLNLEGYISRPLANFYMKNPINGVMDAVIFNRDMRKPQLDRNFFLKINPENKNIKPEIVE